MSTSPEVARGEKGWKRTKESALHGWPKHPFIANAALMAAAMGCWPSRGSGVGPRGMGALHATSTPIT